MIASDALNNRESLSVPDQRRTKRHSAVPTASSIYSQSSPEVDNDSMDSPPAQIPRSSSIYPEDVSPPDSPVTNGGGLGHSRKSSYNVSPISADHPSSFASRSPSTKPGRYNSNLPVPKKNLKKFWKLPDKASGSPNQESTTVRWDEYSGEPTTSDNGKPPSTTPGAVKLHEDPTPGRPNQHNFGTSTHISGGNIIPRKRVGNREVSDTSITIRPEWRGAGGRHKIVPPPPDKPLPDGQSPKFPPGSNKKQQMEDEERAKLEKEHKEEKERLEQVEREQADRRRREEENRRGLELLEQERVEAQRRELERTEQLRIERERAEQERRTREKVVQARRERDLVAQAQKREQALRAEAEREQEAQRAQQQKAQDAKSPSSNSTFSPTVPRQSSESAAHLDAQEAMHAAMFSQDLSSRDSASISTSSTHAGKRSIDSPKDDTRSPLARNPSDEEVEHKRAGSDDDMDKYNPIPPPPLKIRSPEAQAAAWQPRGSSLTAKDVHKNHDPSLIESRFRAELQNMTISEEPRSRFSTTTYATTTFNDSPPATPEIPPDSPTASLTNTPDSILNRKRPVPTAGISRKPIPIPSESPKMSPDLKVVVDPKSLNSKSLPKAPPDVPKVPPVQTLQAKQDALRRRKHNIETVIHELTEVVQPSSIAYDMASRQEIKRTVEQLKRELAEVIKDEHETGLKLHRAWKRQDGMAIYEPTSIWVRRVTT